MRAGAGAHRLGLALGLGGALPDRKHILAFYRGHGGTDIQKLADYLAVIAMCLALVMAVRVAAIMLFLPKA